MTNAGAVRTVKDAMLTRVQAGASERWDIGSRTRRCSLVWQLRDGRIALDPPGLADYLRRSRGQPGAIDQPSYSGLKTALAASSWNSSTKTRLASSFWFTSM